MASRPAHARRDVQGASGRSRYDRWHLARHDARAQGATPSLRIITAHEWVPDPEQLSTINSQLSAVTLVEPERRDENRPGGLGFGVLVHAVLAQAPFDATRQALDDLAAVEARALGLSDDEASAAAAMAERLLSHELFRRAHAADARGACRPETPVTFT